MRKIRLLVGLAILCPAAAQITTTTMIGTIADSTGAAVPNAQVMATNIGTNLARTATTNSQGEYRIEFLPVGSYQVEVSAPGFKKFVRGGVVLEINETARVDAQLQIGGLNETVTVTSEAPLVNTDNAVVGRTVENAEIIDLPIVNRNVYTLLTLTRASSRRRTASFWDTRNSAP